MSSRAAQSEKICFFFLGPRHGQNPLLVVYVSTECAKRDRTLDALWLWSVKKPGFDNWHPQSSAAVSMNRNLAQVFHSLPCSSNLQIKNR